MRRRLEAFIPIVLLAVLVQLMAPIAAFRVVADATSDALYMATICSETMHSADDQTAPAKSPHNGGCCAFCASGSGGSIALETPSPTFVTLQRQFQLVSWLEDTDSLPVLRSGSNAQARAPPRLT